MSHSMDPGRPSQRPADGAAGRPAGAADPATRGRAPADPQSGRRGINRQPVNWLLLVPLIGVLVPQFYNFNAPSIGGMPFFYWYQLAWIAVSVILTWIVYRSTRGER